MAFPDKVTIDTHEFDLVVNGRTNSIRSNAASALSTPSDLTISHETNKAGRVSSVVIRDFTHQIDCDAACNIVPTIETTRAMFKIQYNPTLGIPVLDTEMRALRDDIITFISDDSNFTKILNKES